jgi:electron transport complex protein RnfG
MLRKQSGDIMNAGLRLLLIACVAALLLAATNMITRGPIEAQANSEAIKARQTVMPDADSFADVTWPEGINLAAYPSLTEAREARRGDTAVGYIFQLKPMGYKAEIPVTVGIALGNGGTIVGIYIGAISETSGLGTRIKDEPFLSQFRSIGAGRAGEVNTISGATISSAAVKSAVSTAVQAYNALGVDTVTEATQESAGSNETSDTASSPTPTTSEGE